MINGGKRAITEIELINSLTWPSKKPLNVDILAKAVWLAHGRPKAVWLAHGRPKPEFITRTR
ncbi:MAG: hypothetical protein B6247_24550 [Candidatus Parabeggiatoa sp. nov. 2]|nr:MAG: hypothetical protein B6247_24550 [Beggiatoa sp. 4572_84]